MKNSRVREMQDRKGLYVLGAGSWKAVFNFLTKKKEKRNLSRVEKSYLSEKNSITMLFILLLFLTCIRNSPSVFFD